MSLGLPSNRRVLLLSLTLFTLMIMGAFAQGQTTLFGDTAVERQRDSNALGSAEAFQTTATATRTLATLTLYVDSSSTVRQINAGVYSDNAGHPGTLLTQGSITTISPAAWNTINVAALSITSGTKYCAI